MSRGRGSGAGSSAGMSLPLVLGLVGAAVVMAWVAAAGLSRAAAVPSPTFLSLGLAGAEVGSDGSIHLVLDIENPAAVDRTGHLRVSAQGAGGAQELWAGDVGIPGGRVGDAIVDIPGACDVRLSIVLEVDGQTRSLTTLVPCQAARASPGAPSPAASSPAAPSPGPSRGPNP